MVLYQVSDAQGIAQGSLRGRALDRVSMPGEDLKTIIDIANAWRAAHRA